MSVEQKVKQIIVEQLGVDEAQVDPTASFVDDLGADSLDIVELVMAFEEAFDLDIPDEDAEKIADRQGRHRLHRVEEEIVTVSRRIISLGVSSLQRRVVVTGVGLLTSVGIGTEAGLGSHQEAARTASGPLPPSMPPHFNCRIAGEVKDFDPAHYIEKKEIKKMGRFIQFAIAAAEFALQGSGFKVNPEEAERTGVYIGSGIGGFEVIEREHKILLEKGPARISPFFIPATIINLASGYVSIRTGAKGPNSATATACTTSAHSIGDSFRIIQHDDADVMICGGAEACITPMGIGGFAAMRALSQRNDDPAARLPSLGQRSRRLRRRRRRGHPGSRRTGTRASAAARRFWRKSSAMACRATRITSLRLRKTATARYRVMRNRLRDAGLEPHQIDYINAHGTSTPVGDRIETHRHQARLRRACLQGRGQFHEVHDRASAGRRGRPGGRDHGAGDSRSDRAADHQSTIVPIRSATSITFRITRVR